MCLQVMKLMKVLIIICVANDWRVKMKMSTVKKSKEIIEKYLAKFVKIHPHCAQKK